MRRATHGPSSAERRRLDEQARKIERMRNVIAEITAENIEFKKKEWGTVRGGHVGTEAQERVRKDLTLQQERTGIPVAQLLSWWGISRSTFYGWGAQIPMPSRRYNPATVLPEEEQAVSKFRPLHREVGYPKLTWLMNDSDVVALSEPAVYKVLSKHNLLGPWSAEAGDAAAEYQHKPSRVHEHCHTEIAYVKVARVIYFLFMMLDGCSR